MAVNRYPEVILKSLRRSGAVSRSTTIKWTSPLREEDFKESKDTSALDKAGITSLPKGPLSDFWPKGGPRWDAIGRRSDGVPIFVEAKAHISEVNTPPTGAKNQSKQKIEKALAAARKWYPRPKLPYKKPNVPWGDPFYQYVNRLAHHYFLREVNHIPSVLIFIYFLNDTDMDGPRSTAEWKRASQLVHALINVSEEGLRDRGVFDAYVDVRDLQSR